MTMSRFLQKAALWSVVIACSFPVGSATAAFGPRPAAFTGGYAETRGAETVKVLSVLALRSSGGKVLGKAAEKLAAMSDRDLRLIASLCDRISADRGTAGAEIAVSLITAMIVLS